MQPDQVALENLSATAKKRRTTARREGKEPQRNLDLERREDRFIIYVRDTRELVETLEKHTQQLSFPDSPVTRTVYFGDDARGLPPGLSIKARSYERERLPGRWDLDPESRFALLEIKRTVEVEQELALSKRKRRSSSTKSGQQKTRDTMVEILVPLRDRCSFGRFPWLISQALSATYVAGELRLYLERNCRLPESPSRRASRGACQFQGAEPCVSFPVKRTVRKETGRPLKASAET